MAIRNFQFPGVELRQVFEETPVTGVSTLGVAIVGNKFKSNSVSWVYGGTASTIDLSKVAYCTAGEAEDLAVIVNDGLFLNYSATDSSTELAITGGSAASNVVTVVFNADVTGATAAFGTELPAVGDAVDVNNKGSANGTIAAINGATVTIDITGGTVADGATITAVKFYKIVEEAELNDVGVTGTTLSIPANVKANIGGKESESSLEASDTAYSLKLRYNVASKLALKTVGSLTEVYEEFGEINNDNKMALAVAFALMAANGNVVNYVGVLSDDATGYVTAMDYLDRFDEVYSVVPLTYDADILRQLVTSAEGSSEDTESKVRRTVWYGLETPATDIVDGLITARKNVAASYRAQAVWADGAMFNGEVVDNFVVAAAAAGMRSYEPTYRPISNLAYTFFTIAETNGLTKSDLERIGSNGIWIVANNFEGTPINKRQVTTAVANNLNLDEESIVANADSIALTLCHVGEDLVGCSNISPALIKSLSDTITAIMDTYLINRTGNTYIGPQLLSWTLDSLYQHEVLLDHIYAVITCEPPKPFNRFVMTLRIV